MCLFRSFAKTLHELEKGSWQKREVDKFSDEKSEVSKYRFNLESTERSWKISFEIENEGSSWKVLAAIGELSLNLKSPKSMSHNL